MQDDKPIQEGNIYGITLVPQPSASRLTDKQQVDYASHRKSWLKWSLNMGKNPKRLEGYSSSTMENRAYRVDQFFRFVWDERGEYTTNITHEDGDAYMKELAFGDGSGNSNSNMMKAVKSYFKWLHHEKGMDEWDPEYTFSTPNQQASTADSLTREQRTLIREAALEYGSVPDYSTVTPEERKRFKQYLAARFEKPMEEVGLEDWERANGWKYTSLVWVSMDTGLRPCEVETATVDWVDLDQKRLVIRAEDEVKVHDDGEKRDWTPVLQEKTVEALRRWLDERECYERYQDSDKIWLTKNGNPYDSHNLSYLLGRLCDIAGIEQDLSWYAIRRSTVSHMIEAKDLSTAAEQVRHRDLRSTRRYHQVSDKERRDGLNQIG